MAIDINNNILEIEKTATTDADYTGKKIVELPDTVINSAQELKERFDAALIDVLDPKYRDNVNAVKQAFTKTQEQVNAELIKKSDVGHSHTIEDVDGVEPQGEAQKLLNAHDQNSGAHETIVSSLNSMINEKADKNHSHAISGNEITGTLSVAKGGTGATTADSARSNLGAAAIGHKHDIGDIEGFDIDDSVAQGLINLHNEDSTAHHQLFDEKADTNHTHTQEEITGTLAIEQGGTGATSASQALTNLGAAHVGHLHQLSGMGITGTLPITKGGTGATTKEQALANLEAASTSHTHSLTSSTISGTLPITKGGTGATSASSALSNLGAASTSHTHALTSSLLTGTLPIEKGGTGATSTTGALNAFGMKAGSVGLTIPANELRVSTKITFDTPYANGSYAIAVLPASSVAGGEWGRTATFNDKTASGFTVYLGMNNTADSNQTAGITWITAPYVNE